MFQVYFGSDWSPGDHFLCTSSGTPSGTSHTLASFSPSSLFTTLSWAESTCNRNGQEQFVVIGNVTSTYLPVPCLPARLPCLWLQRGRKRRLWQSPGIRLTLFPSNMRTTSCCAYSWISVSQAWRDTAKERGWQWLQEEEGSGNEGELPQCWHCCHPKQCWGCSMDDPNKGEPWGTLSLGDPLVLLPDPHFPG